MLKDKCPFLFFSDFVQNWIKAAYKSLITIIHIEKSKLRVNQQVEDRDMETKEKQKNSALLALFSY